jgi:hypothetical protein
MEEILQANPAQLIVSVIGIIVISRMIINLTDAVWKKIFNKKEGEQDTEERLRIQEYIDKKCMLCPIQTRITTVENRQTKLREIQLPFEYVRLEYHDKSITELKNLINELFEKIDGLVKIINSQREEYLKTLRDKV